MNKDKIDSFLAGPNRKKGDLRQAYEIARDPTSWNEEQNNIVRNYEQSLQDAAEEEEENQDQLEEDQEDVEDVEDEEPSSKKRKRGPESGKIRESADKRKKSKAAEPAKVKVSIDLLLRHRHRHRPQGNPHSSLNAMLTLSRSTFPISHAQQPEKPNSKVTNGGSAEDKSEEHLDPETKKVKEWRHKVQKVFLGKDGTINPEEMPAADSTFKTVEEYDGMTTEHLRTTKIGKVMKRVMQLSEIPRDDEFHFRDRAEKLCAKWGAIMAGGESVKEPSHEASSQGVKENGHSAAAHADEEPKSEADASAAPEPAAAEASS